MPATFFSLPIYSKRDLLRLRQLSRHAASLLGFGSDDQVCLAAAAFDLACQAFTVSLRAEVRFEISDRSLCIFCTPLHTKPGLGGEIDQRALQIEKKLPHGAIIEHSDLPWALQQLAEHAPLDPFEEIERINRELLEALLNNASRSDILPARRVFRAA